MHLNNVQWTSLNNSNCQVTHDFPGGHWIREWESNPQPADPGKNGESPWFDFFRNDDESLILLLNWRMYIFTQAWNCEARTRASPWKQRPQVLVVYVMYIWLFHPPIHQVPQVARRSRKILGQIIAPCPLSANDHSRCWHDARLLLLVISICSPFVIKSLNAIIQCFNRNFCKRSTVSISQMIWKLQVVADSSNSHTNTHIQNPCPIVCF